MRKIKNFLKTGIIILFIIIGIGFITWQNLIAPVFPDSQEEKIFVIAPGWGVKQIAAELKETGLIKSSLAFQIMVYKLGIGNKIQAGDFRLSPAMSLTEIAEFLTHGTLDVWVTIPEGLRREEIARVIANSFTGQKVEFDYQEFVKTTKTIEGNLFPDTYLLPKEASAGAIAEIFKNTFEQKFSGLILKTDLTKQETVIFASLIEREAKYESDRALIAGILIKRFEQDWPLQVDCAVQYFKGSAICRVDDFDCQWWPSPKPEDLKQESLYNTYKNLGLPPTAICNPGLASLKAAAAPKDSEYWFYLADKTGKTHYAKTYEEHQENIENYLK